MLRTVEACSRCVLIRSRSLRRTAHPHSWGGHALWCPGWHDVELDGLTYEDGWRGVGPLNPPPETARCVYCNARIINLEGVYETLITQVAPGKTPWDPGLLRSLCPDHYVDMDHGPHLPQVPDREVNQVIRSLKEGP